MEESDTPVACFVCAQPLAFADLGGVCVVCSNVFCTRHVVIRDGVRNCAACEEVRRGRENTSAISQADVDEVVRLLRRDIDQTVGAGHEAVTEAAARLRLFIDDPVEFAQQVVDEVQQFLHDSFVDTSWPPCPEHPNHPLWFAEGWWWCDASRRRVAPLGELTGTAGQIKR